jgi:succinate dehydrogenase/fumarate reductase cytochrome b subunit
VTRNVLYLTFAVSPLYVFTLQIAGKLGAAEHHNSIWIAGWIAVGAALYFQRARSAPGSDRTEAGWLRVIHGTAALCVLFGFLIAHLVNHDLAIWSVELHQAAMEWLRVGYRSEWLEPVLLTLLLAMIATGVPMVVQHSRRDADAFRIVQMATGVYIGVFLCAHLVAVLGARSAGIETDWFFATGNNGLLAGRGMLIPYYIYATFFLTLHVGCGLRIVLMKHGVAEIMANKAVYTVAGAGLLVTTPLTIAALGFQIRGS